jgi:Glycosyl hydrolases family 25
MLKGIDISNLQAMDHLGTQSYRDADFTIVQAITPPRPYRGWERGGYTADQLRQAKADGKKVGAYVWLWNSFTSSAATKADIAARLATIPHDVPLDMRLWLDVEDTGNDFGPPRFQDVLDALEVMDAWASARNLPPSGVYSGQWYLSGYMDGWFPEGRVYWLADYSIPPELFPMRPVHQFTSTPLDTDAMLESEILNAEADVPAIDYVPQEYRDKFGATTPYDVYANLEGIIHSLQSQLATSDTGVLRAKIAKALSDLA